jgi:peroxiredoxin
MVPNICLVTCALLMGQASDRSEWLVLPRLDLGQELVYRGSFAEEALGRGVHFSRSYRLETRAFVLDTPPGGLDVAFYTVYKPRTSRAEQGEEATPVSIRLESARVTSQGRLKAPTGTVLAVPLDGPPTVECGAFVEVPQGHIRPNQVWEATDENRPPRTWKVLGTETVNNTACLKLDGNQQSDDWDQPRADHTAWRRHDTVWLALNLGVAYKVERVIERRDAAQREPSQRSVIQYEYQSSISYPGKLFEDRRREILQARKFYEEAAPYLPTPTKYGPVVFDGMLARITYHLDHNPRTPYRDAVLQVKRQVEAARRGESPPPASHDEAATPTAATIGQRAPDFVATNLLNRQTVGLHRYQGHPVLLVFYTPDSLKAEEVLRFAQKVQDAHSQRVTVLGLAVADDTDRVRKQHKELALTVPILSGRGLRQSYGVDATPKLVIIDAAGVVRGSYLGWGLETSTVVGDDVKAWVERTEKKTSGTEERKP